MKDTMGIILTESGEFRMHDLTDRRSVSALPIAGRYRLVDFALSNMVNSGIINVGVVPKYKYSSLMDHLGSGKAWDLNRKNYGMFILPPHSGQVDIDTPKGTIGQLFGILDYIRKSRQRYVVITVGNLVCNITYYDALSFHKEKGADITVIYHETESLEDEEIYNMTTLEVDDECRVTAMDYHPRTPKSNNIYMETIIIDRVFLESIIEESVARGLHNLVMDVIIKRLDQLKIYGYRFGKYAGKVNTIKSYYKNNMNILKQSVRDELFNGENLIYTKVKDQVPTKYGNNAKIADCMIADGCFIEGNVENSIIFRGVRIGKDAMVRNCIIMQNTYVQESCDLEHVVIDKECLIRSGKRLIGQGNYPIIIRKRAVV